MTLLVSFTIAKMSPPDEGEINDTCEDVDGDIDRWENDGGMHFGIKKDRSRN